jgi:hypothetical protein
MSGNMLARIWFSDIRCVVCDADQNLNRVAAEASHPESIERAGDDEARQRYSD